MIAMPAIDGGPVAGGDVDAADDEHRRDGEQRGHSA